MKKFIISTALVLGLTGTVAFAQTTTDRTANNGDTITKTTNGNTVEKTVTNPTTGKSATIDKTVNGNQATKTVTGSNGKQYSATSTYGKNGVEKSQTAANGASRTVAHKRAKLR